jgi:ABC-2 type transport system permease protein
MTGTVFDIGYQRYTGHREGRSRGRKAVFKDGLRIAYGLGRGPRAKVLPWFFTVALSFIALVMALVAGAANLMGGAGTAEKANLPTHSDYNGIASIIMFVFAALVGPELLCRDRRDGVINLYLVRPLTGSDYVISRWAALLVVMTLAACLPQVILFLGLSMGDPKPLEYLALHWLDIPRFLAAGLAMAAYATTLSLLVASFTSRRAYASVFMVGLFMITAPFTSIEAGDPAPIGLAVETAGKLAQWISMFNLTNIPVHVNDVIFGEVSEITSEASARLLPAWVRVGWYFLWTVVPGFFLWSRYRRLTP